jgi:hypothetical protein
VRVLVILVLLAHTARADEVGVAVAGEPTMQKSVQAQLTSWLGKHHYTFVADALDADTRTTLLNCLVIEDMACARATVEKRAKAANLVFARVDLVGGDSHELAITGYWFVKDREAVAEKRWCRKCDDAALARSVDELMTYLANAGAAAPAPAVVVKETPSRVVPTALLTVGAAALVTSGGFFYYGHKGGADAPLVYPDATRDGVIFAIGGAAAVATGAYLWWRGSRGPAPIATAGAGAATIGVAGSF